MKPLDIKDTRKWGWSEVGAERCHGPFETREDAIADARFGLDPPSKRITLGRCRFLDPMTYLPDLDEFLERLEERASDDDFNIFDGEEIWEVNGSKLDAEAALQTALQEWAAKYLKSAHWLIEDTEELELPDA